MTFDAWHHVIHWFRFCEGTKRMQKIMFSLRRVEIVFKSKKLIYTNPQNDPKVPDIDKVANCLESWTAARTNRTGKASNPAGSPLHPPLLSLRTIICLIDYSYCRINKEDYYYYHH